MVKESSWDYFFDNQEKWIKQHPGWFIVIKDGKLCGIYMDESHVEANAPKYGDDLLIIQLNPEGIKEYELKSVRG
jgi:hypothetical protein